MALFTPRRTRWDGLINFWHEIYWPYFIGALGPGILLSHRLLHHHSRWSTAYQKARAAKANERRKEKRRKLKVALAEAAARLVAAHRHEMATGLMTTRPAFALKPDDNLNADRKGRCA
jgi:hypothetical protein